MFGKELFRHVAVYPASLGRAGQAGAKRQCLCSHADSALSLNVLNIDIQIEIHIIKTMIRLPSIEVNSKLKYEREF